MIDNYNQYKDIFLNRQKRINMKDCEMDLSEKRDDNDLNFTIKM